MKKIYTTLFLLLLVAKSFSQSYDFHVADSLLTATQNTIYNGKVVCMVKQGDSLIYYKALGGFDSTSTALIASVSKTFSAAVILHLVSQGTMSLNDTLGKYLPKATLNGKGGCTIRQLFSHTGGWPGQDTTMGSYVEDGSLTLLQCADSIITNIPYSYAPGTKFEYGGVSMQLAGAAAQIAAGQSWNSLFNSTIAVPCGLSSQSKYLTSSLINPRIAGGMQSTAIDILKFASMISHNGKINNIQVIDSTIIQEMWYDQTNAAPIIYTPFPINSLYTPYNQDTVRYGIGCWEDVYNPTSNSVEQISGDGLFGTSFWIDRCRNLTGVIFTFAPSNFYGIIGNNLHVEDIIRTAVGGGCSTTTGINNVTTSAKTISIYPNPFSSETTLQVNKNLKVATLTVYNSFGQTVKQIKNISGETITFSRDNLSSGLYFIQLTQDNKIISVDKCVITD
jgi:CubicO group peptidase (beta-lactamase class C family)